MSDNVSPDQPLVRMRRLRPTGALGGDVSMRERYKLRDRYITPLPAVDLTWRRQCRCGSTIYSLWRARYYCRTCARWIRADVVQATADQDKPEHREHGTQDRDS